MEIEISVAAFAAPLIAASTFPQLAHPNRHHRDLIAVAAPTYEWRTAA
jgi:hypothetical protein